MNVQMCNTPHENIESLAEIINSVQDKTQDGFWVISDVDIIPLFTGDYSGNGGQENKNLCIEFKNEIEKESVKILSYYELMNILKDTQTIYRAVLMCFEKGVVINTKVLSPTVETKKQDEMSHPKAVYEIRILDGDMFISLDNFKN